MNITTHLWRYPALLDSHAYAPLTRRGTQADIRAALTALLAPRLPQAREGAPGHTAGKKNHPAPLTSQETSHV